jgi:hypothetical protein
MTDGPALITHLVVLSPPPLIHPPLLALRDENSVVRDMDQMDEGLAVNVPSCPLAPAKTLKL